MGESLELDKTTEFILDGPGLNEGATTSGTTRFLNVPNLNLSPTNLEVDSDPVPSTTSTTFDSNGTRISKSESARLASG